MLGNERESFIQK